MKNKYIKFIILCLLCLNLTACSSRADIETSFDVISELCKSKFAPYSQEEYENTFKKYVNTCISEDELVEFFAINDGVELHTNVVLTNYNCKYYYSSTNNSRYVATMNLSNGQVYADIQVIFYVLDGKIINISITSI